MVSEGTLVIVLAFVVVFAVSAWLEERARP